MSDIVIGLIGLHAQDPLKARQQIRCSNECGIFFSHSDKNRLLT